MIKTLGLFGTLCLMILVAGACSIELFNIWDHPDKAIYLIYQSSIPAQDYTFDTIHESNQLLDELDVKRSKDFKYINGFEATLYLDKAHEISEKFCVKAERQMVIRLDLSGCRDEPTINDVMMEEIDLDITESDMLGL